MKRLDNQLGNLGDRQTHGVKDEIVMRGIERVLEKMVPDEVFALAVDGPHLLGCFTFGNAALAGQRRDAFAPNPRGERARSLRRAG